MTRYWVRLQDVDGHIHELPVLYNLDALPDLLASSRKRGLTLVNVVDDTGVSVSIPGYPMAAPNAENEGS